MTAVDTYTQVHLFVNLNLQRRANIYFVLLVICIRIAEFLCVFQCVPLGNAILSNMCISNIIYMIAILYKYEIYNVILFERSNPINFRCQKKCCKFAYEYVLSITYFFSFLSRMCLHDLKIEHLFYFLFYTDQHSVK